MTQTGLGNFRRERLWPTPADKRRFAAPFKDVMPDEYARWMGLADCQEAGRLEEYEKARRAWQAAEPHPKDFA